MDSPVTLESYLFEQNTWCSPKYIADFLGLPIETLQNWRATCVGPSYIKVSKSVTGRVRYRLEDVLEWQKQCERVIPAGWKPIGTFPGERVPEATDRIEWLPPGRTAIALGISIPTLTAWYKRAVGLPFIWIGGRGQHKYMYDRHDVEAFISRRMVDPSIVPVIAPKTHKEDPRTPEERKRMMAKVLQGMGYSDDQIRSTLGRRWADLIWP